MAHSISPLFSCHKKKDKPVVGSSSKTIEGFPTRAIAKDNFLLFPPEYVFTKTSAYFPPTFF